MLVKICNYFLIFLIFSVVGWIVETLLYILRDGKAVKRGFLFGPVCPIYGCAAIICDLLIYRVLDNVIYIALAGFLLTGILEYVTHFVMEKVFHAMWWDYSDRRFNINGRVYLKGLLFFAVGSVLIVKVMLPAIYDVLGRMPDNAIYWISFIVYTLLVTDVATTFADLKGTIRALKHIQATATKNVQKGVDLTAEQVEAVKEAILNNKVITSFQKSHPTLTLKRYKYLLDTISDKPNVNKKRKDIKLYGTAETIPEDETAEEETEKKKTSNG